MITNIFGDEKKIFYNFKNILLDYGIAVDPVWMFFL